MKIEFKKNKGLVLNYDSYKPLKFLSTKDIDFINDLVGKTVIVKDNIILKKNTLYFLLYEKDYRLKINKIEIEIFPKEKIAPGYWWPTIDVKDVNWKIIPNNNIRRFKIFFQGTENTGSKNLSFRSKRQFLSFFNL